MEVSPGAAGSNDASIIREKMAFTFGSNRMSLSASLPTTVTRPDGCTARFISRFISPLAYVAHPPAMAWASFDAPGWLRWAGVGLGGVVIASVHWVLGNLGRNVSETVLTKESHELVTSGPYRWIRHPLYTTGIALFVALGLIAANWFILLWAAAALVAIRLAVIPREERELRARFGRAYDDLVSRTGAMWPRAGINREK